MRFWLGIAWGAFEFLLMLAYVVIASLTLGLPRNPSAAERERASAREVMR